VWIVKVLTREIYFPFGGNIDWLKWSTVDMKISQDRADAVKEYLESKGIASDRLQAQGFGSTQPISSGKRAAEKARNRRIELKLSNQ
jgi:OmpA-OmpF porin, OOP family